MSVVVVIIIVVVVLAALVLGFIAFRTKCFKKPFSQSKTIELQKELKHADSVLSRDKKRDKNKEKNKKKNKKSVDESN